MTSEKDFADEVSALMRYYGFQPIEKGQKDWLPLLLDFINYLHGYAKEYISTESVR